MRYLLLESERCRMLHAIVYQSANHKKLNKLCVGHQFHQIDFLIEPTVCITLHLTVQLLSQPVAQLIRGEVPLRTVLVSHQVWHHPDN